jgi:hypothetical protein
MRHHTHAEHLGGLFLTAAAVLERRENRAPLGFRASVPVPKVAVVVTLDLCTFGYRLISPRMPTAIKYTATK